MIADAGRDGGPADAGWDAGTPLPCASDRDCVSGVCRARHTFAPIDLDPLPLGCGVVEVGLSPPAGPCESRADCDRGLCALPGACVVPCTNDSDCAPRERCAVVWVQTSSSAMQSVEACTAIFATPDDVRIAGPFDGPEVMPDDIVEDFVSAPSRSTLVVWSGTAGSVPYIQRIWTREIEPRLVFDLETTGERAPAWGVRAAAPGDMAMLLWPNGPNSPTSATGFRIDFGSEARGSLRRSTLRRDAEAHVIDIDAYIVGVRGRVSPESGLPLTVSRGVGRARALLRQVDMTIGEVRVHEIVGAMQRRYEVIDLDWDSAVLWPEVPELVALSAGARRPSVHVFFVRSIDLAGGLAPGVPGSHGVPGRGASGVVVAVDLADAEWLGKVIVHEIGHFMGLFHTSELRGLVYDPLPDTPECGRDRDANGDGYVLPHECGDDAAGYLMYWAGGERLSPQQGEIMRRALFTR